MPVVKVVVERNDGYVYGKIWNQRWLLTKRRSWHYVEKRRVYLWMSREAFLLWERNRFHKEEEEEEEAVEDWNYIWQPLICSRIGRPV